MIHRLGRRHAKLVSHRVRRHRLGRRGIHVAGGRTAAGAGLAVNIIDIETVIARWHNYSNIMFLGVIHG